MPPTVQKQTVLASCFDSGYEGENLIYAALSTSLNNLSPGHRLRITLDAPPHYPSVLATKGSVGLAINDDPNHPRIAIDFRIAKALGFANPQKFGIREVIIESA